MKILICLVFLFMSMESNLVNKIPLVHPNCGESGFAFERPSGADRFVFKDGVFSRDIDKNLESIERQLRRESFSNLLFVSCNLDDTLKLKCCYSVSIGAIRNLLSNDCTQQRGYALIFAVI